jgi:hypothetical protein
MLLLRKKYLFALKKSLKKIFYTVEREDLALCKREFGTLNVREGIRIGL